MSNYKLIKLKNIDPTRLDHDSTQIEYDFQATCLDEMLEAYSYFLKGCGFSFDGELEIVEDLLSLPESDGDEA